jgi:hypothetical protein
MPALAPKKRHPGGRVHRDAGRCRPPAFATDNRRYIARRRRAGSQSGSTMAVDHGTGHRRGWPSPNAAGRIGHRLLAWAVPRDGCDCFGNGLCSRPTHDSGTDVRRQQPHGCSIRAEQRRSAHWRIGCYGPYWTRDSVIWTCVAFSFWCRRSHGRGHLLVSSGECRYVDRAGGESPTSDRTMMIAARRLPRLNTSTISIKLTRLLAT